ncbi:hypothetical protein LCGC14_0483700 [marine sediment metagenome]|uniref:Uncharacterized protein n=1 Tax=marine sediment metagenome TaxID=412755 RepID=A0A0F9SDV2_9ZZZZ
MDFIALAKGLGLGILLVLAMIIPIEILRSRKEDQREALCLRMKESWREQEHRTSGMAEEDIIHLRETLRYARKEAGLWNKWDEEMSNKWT